MTEKLYRIKPLVWSVGPDGTQRAYSPTGAVAFSVRTDGLRLIYYQNDYKQRVGISVEENLKACEQEHQSFIAQALEQVE